MTNHGCRQPLHYPHTHRIRHNKSPKPYEPFFPGFPSTIPTPFSTAPLILSLKVAFFAFDAGFFFSTRPVVVFLARGLEMLAFGFEAVAGFFVVVVVLVFVFVLVVVVGAEADVVVKGMRGAL